MKYRFDSYYCEYYLNASGIEENEMNYKYRCLSCKLCFTAPYYGDNEVNYNECPSCYSWSIIKYDDNNPRIVFITLESDDDVTNFPLVWESEAAALRYARKFMDDRCGKDIYATIPYERTTASNCVLLLGYDAQEHIYITVERTTVISS